MFTMNFVEISVNVTLNYSFTGCPSVEITDILKYLDSARPLEEGSLKAVSDMLVLYGNGTCKCKHVRTLRILSFFSVAFPLADNVMHAHCLISLFPLSYLSFREQSADLHFLRDSRLLIRF